MKYIIRVIDFETTGIPDDETEHSVVEAAWIDYDAESKKFIVEKVYIVKPETPMDITAQAIHHISYDEAMDSGRRWEFVESDMGLHGDDETLIYVAHNADFERQFFQGAEGAKWIDTYKVALKLYPDAPSHNNQVLKYYLGIPDEPDHHPPHRAFPDCKVTAEILFKMAENMKFNEMIKISREPPYLTRIKFGKHKGEKFEDLPRDYLEWLKKQEDMDDGVKAAVGRFLK